ncbi:hypothetical protein [uncultured Piscinibacter sp.]|uniref:hypothetical protein n=1 Tax=uncultured Piscinibacter sp. TaxID=1131835 RepID=UPI0026329683|nr:hypothetical protein [uncultured Piscinibacter sp.]
MTESGKLEDFSLFGGPLHRVGDRLGLVHGGTNTVPLGLALGVSTWVVLVALALIEGVGNQLFSLPMIGTHVRLLLAIPLLFMCEALVDPRMAMFVGMLVRSRVVPDTALQALNSETARATRYRNSAWPESILLLAAVLSLLIGPQLHLFGVTANFDARTAGGDTSLTGAWYWIVCMTLFRFLLLRWLWRLAIWSHFLWRLSRLELHLVPTHPDRAGGLGYLEVVHNEFCALVLALSAVQAASFAEELAAGTLALEATYPALGLMLVLFAALFLGPLCIFAPRLWACRVKGLADYSILAARYVNEFDRKWLREDGARDASLLGTPDLRSMADLSSSVGIVRDVRLVIVSFGMLVHIASAALLPMVPLLLFKFPVQTLAEKLFLRLFGL